jgi:hypothetical protein
MNPNNPSSLRDSKASREDRAILALLQYPSVPKAAEALGIHPATLWRRLQKPQFQNKLHQARREAFSQNLGRLQQGSSAATSTLLRLMADAQTPASSRVRAAETILRHAQSGLDREALLLRLAQLETQVEKLGSK